MEIHNEFDKKFDIVYCYGLLYHVSKPEELIGFLSKHTEGTLLLETCVDYKKNDSINLLEEDKNSVSQSVTGIGCRPGRDWLFSTLKKYYRYVYMPLTQPDHEQFPLNWTENEYTKSNFTRSVFIASNEQLNNPKLVESVLQIQSL